MKRPLAFLLLSLASYFVSAQQNVGKLPILEIPGAKNPVNEAIGLTLHDSVFLSVRYSTRHWQSRSFWILPDRNIISLDNKDFNNKLFTNVMDYGDSTYFYYVDLIAGNLTLLALSQSNSTGVVAQPKNKITLTGTFRKLITADGHHYLISTSDVGYTIHITEIDRLNILSQKVINSEIKLTARTPFSFIEEHEVILPNIAALRTKMYHVGNFIYLCYDKPYLPLDTLAKTSILAINLKTSETTFKSLPDYHSKKSFATFIDAENLYKYSRNRSGCIIQIYNLSNLKLVQALAFERNKIKKLESIDRYSYRSIEKKSLWWAISNTRTPFIIASTIDSTKTVLKLGSNTFAKYRIQQDNSFYPSSSSGFAEAIAEVMVGVIINVIAASIEDRSEVVEYRTIDEELYFYLEWNGKSSPSYTNHTRSINSMIDDYDFDLQLKKKKFKYKTYVGTENITYGVYYENGASSLSVVKFTKPR